MSILNLIGLTTVNLRYSKIILIDIINNIIV